MKTNKFDTFDEPDDFDKMLFDYYKKQDENIPLSTQNAIKNAFNDKHKSNSTAFVMLKKVAVFILTLGILTTTTVYAKDIVNFIANIFTNSNRGIDTAVDNGYVQNVDMDYVVYNDVGVKVDYLVMDDKSLDISFVYKYFGEDKILDEITFSNLTIKDENNNIICLMSYESVEGNIISNNVYSFNNQQILSNSCRRDSILITSSQNLPNSTTLYIDISQISIKLDNKTEFIDGNWNFAINVNDKFVSSRFFSEYNVTTESPVVTSLTNTSLFIELKLNTLFDELQIYNRNSIILKDTNNNIYERTKMLSQNLESSSTITLIYPITIYDNINNLYLHINLDSTKTLDLNLTK